jgi:hypothetical protein
MSSQTFHVLQAETAEDKGDSKCISFTYRVVTVSGDSEAELCSMYSSRGGSMRLHPLRGNVVVLRLS